MIELISGKEAKLAWANGEKLVVVFDDGSQGCIHDGLKLDIFSDPSIKFRLKPRTITINNIEVPAPFKPKAMEQAFYIKAFGNYDSLVFDWQSNDFGYWRNEGEVRQVIAALRSIFEIK